jgi:hypothetical protein
MTSELPQSAAETRRALSKGHGRKGAALRDRAILAVLSERTIGAAARHVGVGERTLRTWLTNDEPFQTALAEARRAAFDAGMSRVQALTARAVDTLDDLLDAKESPGVRLGAARTVAEIALHQRDAEVIQRKLDEIEALRQHNGWRR